MPETRCTVVGVYCRGHLDALAGHDARGLVVAATLAAFVGSFFGTRLARKVTLRVLQRCVGAGLVLLAMAIGAGLL